MTAFQLYAEWHYVWRCDVYLFCPILGSKEPNALLEPPIVLSYANIYATIWR